MPKLKILLQGRLILAGGQTSELGTAVATARRQEGDLRVPYIPATAIRGAVRLQTEALLRAVGEEVTGPYPFDGDGPLDGDGPPPKGERSDLVARLFGYSAREGERSGSAEGRLRFSDALPLDPQRAVAACQVRTGIEIDDLTGSVVSGALYSREIVAPSREPLIFEADLGTRGLTEREERVLRAAVESTEAIGGERSSGGGDVAIEWLEDEEAAGEAAGEAVNVVPGGSSRARLSITLLEPAHFGKGGPRGNHHRTRGYIPGATVRGAVAWALLRAKATRPESPEFQTLFLDESSPVSFGDGLPAESLEVDPEVRPTTLHRPRSGQGGPQDLLAAELARQRANEALKAQGLWFRPELRRLRPEPVEPRPEESLPRSTRTRVSVDRISGTSASQRLFSQEQLEPWQPPEGSAPARRVRFVSWVEGLDASAAGLLARLEETQVFVGAGRNHGLGRVQVELKLLDDADPDADLREAVARVEGLTRQVEERAKLLCRAAGLKAETVPGDGAGAGEEDQHLLALVASSDFVPAPGQAHPLQEWENLSGPPRRSFLSEGASGGYNERPGEHGKATSAPLKTLCPAVAAGSVFAYSVSTTSLEPLLAAALPRLRRGCGLRIESGCGRFSVHKEIES